MAKNFVVQFKVTPTLASQSCGELWASLFTDSEDGKRVWKEFFVTDPKGKQWQLFIGPDKSSKQRATEVLGKKLFHVLSQVPSLKQGDLFHRKRTGEMLFEWRPICALEVLGPSEAELLWDIDYEGIRLFRNAYV